MEGKNLEKSAVSALGASEFVAFIRHIGKAVASQRLSSCSSCQEAKDKGFVQGECKHGCLGIGSCMKTCKQDAIVKENGKMRIDEDKCIGCKECTSICPQNLIAMVPRVAIEFIPCASHINEENASEIYGYGCIGCGECDAALSVEAQHVCANDCVGCKDCVANCPNDALYIKDGKAVIDTSKCEDCGVCAWMCAKNVPVDKKVLENSSEYAEV